ncbi:oxidoreductase [Halorarius halobius]|uniref:oxidoreductase n=1 Tax=Halorarius halobius TaxID=2962671 RepID=UPI0020CFB64C|nr:oxidoreductase [Halorarius halobius]
MGWSADDVPDCSGQRVVVTGANSGIGLEATRELARAGAAVTMACRSVDRGEAAAADVRDDALDADLSVSELDLADLDSVREFADRFGSELDVLVNNAGVMAVPRSETADGFETQFGVNHLGHFALTGLLLDSFAADARVVTVSSGLHAQGDLDFDDLQHERDYDKWEAYADSKLANLLFAYELDRRFRAADRGGLSVGVHPGYAATNLQYRGPEAEGSRLKKLGMRVANAVVAQPPEQGALPTLYAATASDVEGGSYYGPGGFMNLRGSPERQRSSGRSRDAETAARLWQVSEEVTGVTYDLPAPE